MKKLAGNPGKRALPENEPKPKPVPKSGPPSHLSSHAKTEWRRLVKQLEDLGLLTGVDLGSFEAYCEAYSVWREAKEVVGEAGIIYVTDTGQIKKHPAVQIMTEAARLIRQYAGEFGLTPGARPRLAAGMAANQPPLPGSGTWPEREDPNKPKAPAPPDGFTDADYFGTDGHRTH